MSVAVITKSVFITAHLSTAIKPMHTGYDPASLPKLTPKIFLCPCSFLVQENFTEKPPIFSYP